MQINQIVKDAFLDVAFKINKSKFNTFFAKRSYKNKYKFLPEIHNIENHGFNEKILNRKLFDRNPNMPIFADKVLVKNIIKEIIGEEYIIPTLWHGKNTDELVEFLKNLPPPFVIKANHGSGWNIFIKNESEKNYKDIKAKCEKWLSRKYGRSAGEWLYSEIEPQILIEPFISEDETMPLDYKFFVFNGKSHYIQVDTGREFDHKRCFYNNQWQKQDFELEFPRDIRKIERPKSIEKMIRAAERIGEAFDFVRVDFYEIKENPIFGEVTFYPGSGLESFRPPNWNLHFGNLWTRSHDPESHEGGKC